MYEFSNFIEDKMKDNNKYRYTKQDVSKLTGNIIDAYNDLKDDDKDMFYESIYKLDMDYHRYKFDKRQLVSDIDSRFAFDSKIYSLLGDDYIDYLKKENKDIDYIDKTDAFIQRSKMFEKTLNNNVSIDVTKGFIDRCHQYSLDLDDFLVDTIDGYSQDDISLDLD